MTDCQDAGRILSEALEGAADDKALADAREHCRSCPECARLAAGLEELGALDGPRAPEGLVDSVMRAVREEADKTDDILYGVPLTPQSLPDRRSPWWVPRLVLFASAAVVVIATAFVSIRSLTVISESPDLDIEGESLFSAAVPEAADRSVGSAVTGADEDAAAEDAAEAPDYIAYAGGVYEPGRVSSFAASQLETVGTTFAALDSEASVTREVYESTRGSLYLETDEAGEYLLIQPVTRTVGDQLYLLVPGGPLDRYGMWPQLPSSLPAPTRDDGTPTFLPGGFDNAGQAIYVRAGLTVDTGFALAPGGGNPNWTWWEPYSPE